MNEIKKKLNSKLKGRLDVYYCVFRHTFLHFGRSTMNGHHHERSSAIDCHV